MQVDHHFQENLTNERVDQILGALRNAPAGTPLTTPKEPDPAAVTKPVGKPRVRRVTKDGQ
jgi:hypothetical protein